MINYMIYSKKYSLYMGSVVRREDLGFSVAFPSWVLDPSDAQKFSYAVATELLGPLAREQQTLVMVTVPNERSSTDVGEGE